MPAYSVPDCCVAPFGPNSSVTVQGTIQYTAHTSSNSTIPPTDSRKAGAPVDSRAPGRRDNASKLQSTSMIEEDAKDLEVRKTVAEVNERRRRYFKPRQPSRRFNPGQAFKPGQAIKESGGLEPLVPERKD